MSSRESAKQATNLVGRGEVNVQLTTIPCKTGGGTGEGDNGKPISIGSVFIDKLTDGLRRDEIVVFAAKKLLSLLPKEG